MTSLASIPLWRNNFGLEVTLTTSYVRTPFNSRRYCRRQNNLGEQRKRQLEIPITESNIKTWPSNSLPLVFAFERGVFLAFTTPLRGLKKRRNVTRTGMLGSTGTAK